MLFNVMTAILTNLRVLKAQLIALSVFNIDATTTPAYTKYRMFTHVFWASALYFGADICLFVAGIVSDESGTGPSPSSSP